MDRPGPQRRGGTSGRRGYRELVALLGLLSFGSSVASSFWVVYLAGELGLSSALIASLYAVGLFVAALGAMLLTRVRSVHATRTMIAGIACLAATQLALAFLRGPALHVSFPLLFGAYIPLFYLPWNVLLTSGHNRTIAARSSEGLTLPSVSQASPPPLLVAFSQRGSASKPSFSSPRGS